MISTPPPVGTHVRLNAVWPVPFPAAWLLIVGFLLLGLPAIAQPPNESLTEDFPGLTAKERSRIAKKESEEAKVDAEYQAVMNEAERLFQEQHFEEALAAFRKARALRPYNVYPKVKIKDLEAMLGKSPVAAVPTLDPDPGTQPVSSEPEAAEPQAEEPPVVQRVQQERTAPTEKAIVVPRTSRIGSTAPTVPKRQVESGTAPAPDGVTELRYKEANAFVIERRVVEERRPVVYKRVQHACGQVYYFKDSTGIGERVWKERFNEP